MSNPDKLDNVSINFESTICSVGRAITDVYRDLASTFVLEDVYCNGNETELAQCSHSPWMVHHCLSYNDFDVGVCCSNESAFGGKCTHNA